MERNQAASKALLEQLESSTITDIEDLSEALWVAIDTTINGQYLFKVVNNTEIPLALVIKIFVKIGFSCEDAVRLMMKLHKNGNIILATASEETLLNLQRYINLQVKAHDFYLLSQIIKI
jgi:ATP-dependent Clp protease adapter protein ClpS